MQDRYLTAHEVAKLLHVTPQSIRRYCDSGLIPCKRTLGGHRRIKRADLDAFIGPVERRVVPTLTDFYGEDVPPKPDLSKLADLFTSPEDDNF